MQPQANILSFDEARRAASSARGAAQRKVPDESLGEAATPRPKPSWYTADVVASGPKAEDGDGIFLKAESEVRTSRFADADEPDTNLEEQLEEALEKKKGPLASLRSAAAKSKQARVKEKAGRAYFKQYEAGKASDASQGGPRAALYKGEMGASHKRSARMQNTDSDTAPSQPITQGGASAGAKIVLTVRKVMGRVGFVGVAVILTVAFLYGPAQRLYTDIRERDRLEAEYELLMARNEAIEKHVEALQTEDGVEDVARAELGWVREGEHAVSVSNLNLDDDSDFQSNIVSEDVPMPQTWYSGILDPLFGVS